MRAMAIAITLALVLAWGSALAAEQKRFESVGAAVDALIAALRADDQKALVEILGEGGRPLVSSGDPVSDRTAMTRFVADYDQRHQLEAGGGKVILKVGSDDFPLPIPLVPDGPSWRWDTEAGQEEILNRRVGRNELNAIQVCLAYVDAQREYYSRARTKDGILEYAQRLGSSPGKRDGLFWPTKDGRAAQSARRSRRQGQGRGIPRHQGRRSYPLSRLLLQDPDRRRAPRPPAAPTTTWRAAT